MGINLRLCQVVLGDLDNRAQDTEGLADHERRVNFADGYRLFLEGGGPIGAESQVKLSVHVVVVLIPTVSAKRWGHVARLQAHDRHDAERHRRGREDHPEHSGTV